MLNLFRRGRRGPARVSVQEAAARTGHTDGRPDGAVLLDVREPHEWQAGHAPKAVHLSLSALAAGAALPPRARNHPLMVICRSGNRSRRAAGLLAARGTDAVDVMGGMREWARAGLPVVARKGQSGIVA
ncbi:rhodanese-like domain-containing protein [Streptomyces sp. YIM S03343]